MKKWSNLIRDVEPSRPDEIWVSDITYIEIVQGTSKSFLYLSLITDAFTHEIVGYAIHDTLNTTGPLRALNMALSNYPEGALKGLIHHSDRGCQYCSQEYIAKLQQHGILISMTEKGDPYENAVAERVNGILKTEWLYYNIKVDPMLSMEKAIYAGNAWRGKYDEDDYRVSSINGDLAKLKKVTIFVGTHEFFYPDNTLLYEKMKDRGVKATIIVGENLNHVYPAFPSREGHQAVKQIKEIINRKP